MKGHGEDKDLRSVGCHLKEETGSATSDMGLDSQYWKSADPVIFQTGLETARPELFWAWVPTTTTS